MPRFRLVGFFLMVGLMTAAVSCSDRRDDSPDAHAHTHGPPGPNGGEMVEVPGATGYLEGLLNHGSQTLVVWCWDGHPGSWTAVPIPEAPVLRFPGKPEPITAQRVEASGNQPATWFFEDPVLAGEPDGAVVELTLGGKSYAVPLAHHHH